MAKKSVKRNYIYNLAYQILLLVVPLITTPYISQVLGTNGVGIYSYTLSIATYFVLFGSLGVAMYGQREIAYLQDNKKESSKVFWEISILKCITMGISLLIFYFTYANGTEYQVYYKILMLEILANMIDISWFLQGLEEFKKTVIRNIVVKILSVIAIFIFVNDVEDTKIYLIIYTVSNLLGNLSLWAYLPKFLSKVNIKELKIIRHLKPTIALFIPQIAMQVYTLLDKTMIGNILGDMSEVGIYEQSQKIIKMPLTVITALGTVVAPRIANIVANNKREEIEQYIEKSFGFAWLAGIPMMFGIMAISKNFVPWFLGEEFNKAIWVMIIGAPIIIAVGLNNVSGIQYLIPAKKQNIFTRSVVIGAIFNFCINLMLIPILKSVGAIIASVFAEILIFGIQLYYIRKDFNLKIVYKDAWKYVVSGIIMFIFTFVLGEFMNPTIITTFVQICVGGLIYIILLILMKEKMLYQFLGKIKNRG